MSCDGRSRSPPAGHASQSIPGPDCIRSNAVVLLGADGSDRLQRVEPSGSLDPSEMRLLRRATIIELRGPSTCDSPTDRCAWLNAFAACPKADGFPRLLRVDLRDLERVRRSVGVGATTKIEARQTELRLALHRASNLRIRPTGGVGSAAGPTTARTTRARRSPTASLRSARADPVQEVAGPGAGDNRPDRLRRRTPPHHHFFGGAAAGAAAPSAFHMSRT
jgi:hypothetical protein